MKREDSLYPADWLRIAEKDWGRISHLLDVRDPEAAGFYLQQAVEKFLKAFLLSKGWKLDKIHDLEKLLNDALAYDSSLEEFRPTCQKITAFYFVERYPFVTDVFLTEEDIRGSMKEIEKFVEKLRAATQ
ncbi:MAG: HEPN domain-containing protein [bacterium]